MEISLHHNVSGDPDISGIPLYFQGSYLHIHPYHNLHQVTCGSVGQFFFLFDLVNGIAKSLPYSPFGSYANAGGNFEDFSNFIVELEREMIQKGVRSIEVAHPAVLYENFVPLNWLHENGYRSSHVDINQHIQLTKPVSLHPMQRRKLKKLENTRVVPVSETDFHRLHAFIAAARVSQGLVINIDEQRFIQLLTLLPDRYEAWVLLDEKDHWMSVVLMTLVTDKIAYYYLPATAPDFRTQSPMVRLLHYLREHYASRRFTHLDLGLSSVKGQKQVGLFDFKERMGAQSLPRHTLIRHL